MGAASGKGEKGFLIICHSAVHSNDGKYSGIIAPQRNTEFQAFKSEIATMKPYAKSAMLAMVVAGAISTGGAAWAQSSPAPAAPAGDAAAGAKLTSMCIGCHGIEGYKTAFPEVYNVPRIGGQHAAYIVKALQAYKSGDRNHPSMKGIAATLSDKDMADLAAHYSGSPAKTAGK